MQIKTRIIITILLFIVTITSGSFLIKVGIDTARETKIKLQEEKNNQKIEKLEIEKEALVTQEATLKQEQLEEYSNNGESEKYSELETEIKKITEDKKGLNFEISKIKNGYYNNAAGMNKSVASSLLYITPGIILCMSSFIIVIFGIKKKSK